MVEYVSHEHLKDGAVERRLYQLNIASTASDEGCLVVLPTGLGKTVVALLVAVNRVAKGRGPVLMLAPTRPLVEQHARFFSGHSELETVTLTGETPPAERGEFWSGASPETVFLATPQAVENDLIAGRLLLGDFGLLVFDEAHRASGEYPYGWIASRYSEQADNPLSLGLTASPGNDPEDVDRIREQLGLEAVEARSDESPDVRPYVHRREVEWVKVKLPEKLEGASGDLKEIMDDRLDEAGDLGYRQPGGSGATRKQLLDLQRRVQGRIASDSNPPGKLFRAASLVAEAMKVRHCIDVLETQGPGPGLRYMDRVVEEARGGGSKASKRLVDDPRFKRARRALEKHGEAFPKMERLKELLRGLDEGSRAIVFTNYRDTASVVVDGLEDTDGVRPVRFVGQSSRNGDRGLNQDEQASVLESFGSGEYNVLVGTSVAEEGLDVPSTDLVVFYEPVASAIRSVQRKGRTGRARSGRIVVMMTRGTKDEGMYWASRSREDRMEESMKELARSSTSTAGASTAPPAGEAMDTREGSGARGRGQSSLKKFGDRGECGAGKPEGRQKAPVVVDHRESRSGITRKLSEADLDLVVEQLSVGDFVIGDRVCVERKEADDFLSSFIDGESRLFRQAAEIVERYPRPVLIIEGEGLYGKRNVHPNAVRGALASLILDFGVPVLRTRGRDETASIIESMARREGARGAGKPVLHDGKSSDSLTEQQIRLVSSVKGVGPGTARRILEGFGTVEAIASAEAEELMEVSGVGEERARSIVRVFSEKFGGGGS
ncbi:MAG: 3'-flap repair endonuclease Xpf [Methanonatronarchaeales archaeon]|nr:3'-flap repair endonuclease Xpf [Methanonatronarchaeales archaeon]